MMNLTVPNGSKAGDDSNDGDDHANAIKTYGKAWNSSYRS